MRNWANFGKPINSFVCRFIPHFKAKQKDADLEIKFEKPRMLKSRTIGPTGA